MISTILSYFNFFKKKPYDFPPKEGNINSFLPNELLTIAFSSLSVKDLTSASLTCRRWSQITLNQTFFNEYLNEHYVVIDEKVWEETADLGSLDLFFDDISPLKIQTLYLAASLSSLPLEKGLGVAILTLPGGLTREKLAEIALSPKSGCSTHLHSHFYQQIDDSPLPQTERVVITTSLVQGSREIKPNSEEENRLLQDNQCEITKSLHLASLAILTRIHYSTRFFSDHPTTYGRCSDRVKTGRFLIGGNFGPMGFKMHVRASSGEIFSERLIGFAVMKKA